MHVLVDIVTTHPFTHTLPILNLFYHKQPLWWVHFTSPAHFHRLEGVFVTRPQSLPAWLFNTSSEQPFTSRKLQYIVFSGQKTSCLIYTQLILEKSIFSMVRKGAYCSQIRFRYFSSQKACLFWPCKISPVGSNLKISNACWLPGCCPWDGLCQLETRVGKYFYRTSV